MQKRILMITTLCLLFVSSCTLPVMRLSTAQISTTPLYSPSSTITPKVPPTPNPLPSDHAHNGDVAFFNGDYNKALDEYKFALNQSIDPSVIPNALFGIGKVYVVKQDCQISMDAFNQLVTQYPSSPFSIPVYFYAAQCFDSIGNYIQAANTYDAFLQIKPGIIDEIILEKKGDALVNSGDFAGAIHAYSSSLAANPPADFDTIQLKIGRAYATQGNFINAIQTFLSLYDTTLSDYTKAACNLLLGQAYLALGEVDQANLRFSDSVNNFPKSYDAYSALVQLVNTNAPVNDYNRGLVDYYAEQYYPAIDAFLRFIKLDPEHSGSAHYYLGLSYFYTDQTDLAIQQYDSLLADHSDNKYWAAAWDEKAYIQWYKNEKYADAAQTLLDYVSREPGSSEAPGYLFEAARIYERGNLLPEAAVNWERLINEYPFAENSLRGLFLAGITLYRMGQYDKCIAVFERFLQTAFDSSNKASAHFWLAKSKFSLGDSSGAKIEWEIAKQTDPGGYYSIRANEVLTDESLLRASSSYDLGYDLNHDRIEAETWLRSRFNIPQNIDLSGLGDLAGNIHLERGDLFWQIGMKDSATNEFEAIRKDVASDAINSYRLLNHLIEVGLYRSAIFTSRQILDLAGLDDITSLQAPIFFNHIRFGSYYRDLVTSHAASYKLDPLLVLSVIRQESFFDSDIQSSAGAIGLMQIMPATGQEIAGNLGWPQDYKQSDLYRPVVNILYGMSYLSGQRSYLNGDIFAAVAAYNAGPGFVQTWMTLAQNDPDLFLEIIRFNETRTYIINIVEFHNIYRALYER
jgi:soluble lytic murein transglycosylase